MKNEVNQQKNLQQLKEVQNQQQNFLEVSKNKNESIQHKPQKVLGNIDKLEQNQFVQKKQNFEIEVNLDINLPKNIEESSQYTSSSNDEQDDVSDLVQRINFDGSKMIICKQIRNEEKTTITQNRLKFQNLTPTASMDQNELKNQQFSLKSNKLLDFPKIKKSIISKPTSQILQNQVQNEQPITKTQRQLQIQSLQNSFQKNFQAQKDSKFVISDDSDGEDDNIQKYKFDIWQYLNENQNQNNQQIDDLPDISQLIESNVNGIIDNIINQQQLYQKKTLKKQNKKNSQNIQKQTTKSLVYIPSCHFQTNESKQNDTNKMYSQKQVTDSELLKKELYINQLMIEKMNRYIEMHSNPKTLTKIKSKFYTKM